MKTDNGTKKEKKKKITSSLKMRLTVFVGCAVLGSILIAFGMVMLLNHLFPPSSYLTMFIELAAFSMAVATAAAYFMSKMFFDPIKELCAGMKKVAGGDFGVSLETRSSSNEIKELFDGFNMMTKELASTESLQMDFVSNVSHEFKTPINAIEGYTTLLQSTENIDEVENGYIEKIIFNTRRLSSLVSNVLLLSKIESQTIKTHQELYGLDEQIRESIVALEAAWAPKDIEFDVELDDIDYYGNEVLMRHVWDNLIGNAVKFSPGGGEIKIRLCVKDGRIVFTIEDRGPGISEGAIKHIFDKFYQEDTSHKDCGNGLGLALVKRILTTVGGEICAENREGGGCRFTVLLSTAG